MQSICAEYGLKKLPTTPGICLLSIHLQLICVEYDLETQLATTE
jgi:hypothetical protein